MKFNESVTVITPGLAVIVTKRADDFHAGLYGLSSTTWGCGKTIEDALESFLRTFESHFPGAIQH